MPRSNVSVSAKRASFAQEELYATLGIDTSKLTITEHTSVYKKARDLYNAMAEAAIKRAENGHMFVKVMCARENRGRVVAIGRETKYEELVQKMGEIVGGRKARIEMGNGQSDDLGKETFETAKRCVKEGKSEARKLMIE